MESVCWFLLHNNEISHNYIYIYLYKSILKEISPGCSLEGIMLKLKLQYFGHLMRRVDSLEKTDAQEWLGAGGKGDNRGWDGWMASPTWWMWVWVNSGRLLDREACCAVIHGVAKSRTRLSNWTELIYIDIYIYINHFLPSPLSAFPIPPL